MGWCDNRRRSICRKIMFTPEEWEQARRIHERWARNIPVYRRWGDFARQTLMHGALMNVSVTLASDPEVFKAELHHIGVNVNQIARALNTAVMEGKVLDLEVAYLDALRTELRAHMFTLREAFEGNLAYWAIEP